jgi:N,N'-diacetylchitobiose transport system substrate-binding protein
MKVRLFAAAALVLTLALAASTASARTNISRHAAASKITVWLQVDAQSGWPNLVAAANADFQAKHPGTDVDVQYQTWGDHLSKFDATLAGGNTPDVIEMGNTEMTKYMAAGAFAPPGSTTARRSASRTTRARASSPTGATCSIRPTLRSRRASRRSPRRPSG